MPFQYKRYKSEGFTILELLVGVAILAITMALAAPNFIDMVKNNRISSASSDFMGALQLAKTEAASRVRPVSICKSNADGDDCVGGGDWQQGWLIFVDLNANGDLNGDDTIIFVNQALDDQITFGGTDGVKDSITFNPSGTTSLTSTETLILCDERDFDNSAKGILISITGRASTVSRDNSGQTTCL